MKPEDENTIEMIYQFLDSELPDSSQDKLFNEMVYNKALRKEFIFAYNSKNSLMMEYADASVPKGLESKVMSFVDKTPKFPAALRNIFNLKNLTNSILSTVVGSLITFAVMSNIYANKEPISFNGSDKNKSIQTEKMDSKQSNNSMNNLPITSTKSNHHSKPLAANKQTKRVQEISNVATDESMPYIALDKSYTNRNSHDINSNFSYVSKINSIEPNIINEDNSLFDLHKVYIELNSLNTLKLFPYRDISNFSSQDYTNISLSAKYKFADNQYLGIEYGRETFPIFVENLADGFDKKSYISWFGAVYQYDFDELGFNISPIGKIFLGGNESGPILKGDFGFVWQADSKIRFSLTLSGTELIYKYKGNWYDTQKISLKYGAELKL